MLQRGSQHPAPALCFTPAPSPSTLPLGEGVGVNSERPRSPHPALAPHTFPGSPSHLHQPNFTTPGPQPHPPAAALGGFTQSGETAPFSAWGRGVVGAPQFTPKLHPGVPCEQSAPESPWGHQWGDVGRGTSGTRRWLREHTWTKSPCVRDAWERGRCSVPAESGEPRPLRTCSPLSFYRLFMAGLCLLSGAARAGGCNCSNKILIARSRACLRLWE